MLWRSSATQSSVVMQLDNHQKTKFLVTEFFTKDWARNPASMMTSSNGNVFRVTGPLCGEFIGHRWFPRTKASDDFFDLRLNKRLSKQSWGWWFETPSRSLCRHCNELPQLQDLTIYATSRSNCRCFSAVGMCITLVPYCYSCFSAKWSIVYTVAIFINIYHHLIKLIHSKLIISALVFSMRS